MEFIREEKGLKITIDDIDREFLSEIKEKRGEICSDAAECEFFEPFLANSEWRWISPEDICALTSAPILGTMGENDEVAEAYGFMDYAVYSMLEEFEDNGEVFLQKG